MNELVGRWVVSRNDASTLSALGDVQIEFDANGKMDYFINEGDKTQSINMTYRIDGEFIISDQPSHPRPERTKFVLARENVLELWLGGERFEFVKQY